jgi:hypothetical protein
MENKQLANVWLSHMAVWQTLHHGASFATWRGAAV